MSRHRHSAEVLSFLSHPKRVGEVDLRATVKVDPQDG